MSASLQLSKGDNFTEDNKLIPSEQECGNFKVDLLAGHSTNKAQDYESDSETSSEDDEEEDTSDDERKLAENPVLKERLRHLDKYASSFRYDAEQHSNNADVSNYNEEVAVDYRRISSVDERPRGQTIHNSRTMQNSLVTSMANTISPEKNSVISYSVQSIGNMPSNMGYSESNYENRPSLNSNSPNSPNGDTDEYECEVCGAIYTNRSSLRSHLKKHSGQIIKRHQCMHCPYSTQYGKNLAKHIESNHMGAEDCKFRCESCSMSFPSESILRTHEQTHGTMNNYQCEECGLMFKTKLRLKYHADIHNPRKPYICDVEGCDRAFRTPKYLKNHRDEFHHMQPKQYLCPVEGCTLVFHRKTHLKRHVANHDDSEKKFYCTWPDCQRRFRTKESLDMHYNKHTGENPFHCDLCPFNCPEKTILAEHYRQKHSKSSSSSLMSPGSNSYSALHRPLPPPPVLQTTASGGILPASGSDINEIMGPSIDKDESMELFSPNSPSVGQSKPFQMIRTASNASVLSADSPGGLSDPSLANILPSLLAVLEKSSCMDTNAPEWENTREYAKSLLPPFITGEELTEQVNQAADEVIASLVDQPIHVVHAVFASSRPLNSDELQMVESLENQLASNSGTPIVAPPPPRKRGRRPKLQQLLQPYLERMFNLEPNAAEAMAVHLVSRHNAHSGYANRDSSMRGRGRGRGPGRGRGRGRGLDGVHWLPEIDESGNYDTTNLRGQYIGAVRRGGPGSRGGRGRGAYRMHQVMDYSMSRHHDNQTDEDDRDENQERGDSEDDGRRYNDNVDDTDPSAQLRRTQNYSRQKILNDSEELEDEQELDNLGVDDDQGHYEHDALDDQSMDLRKTTTSTSYSTDNPMRPLGGLYPMGVPMNHRYGDRARDGLGEVLEDLGCISGRGVVLKRERSATLYPAVDIKDQRNGGDVDVCSRRSSAAATPSHGPVQLPSMAALASNSTSPADLAPGSGRTNHGQIGPASAASGSTMSPLVGGLTNPNQRPPSRPLAHQTGLSEIGGQVTSPVLHYPSTAGAGMHCNPPSVGGLGGMGPWSESSYGSSSQEAYKQQAPPNVFLHSSPNTTSLQYRHQAQAQQAQHHQGNISPEFHHMQREQVMTAASPSQRMLSSNPYLAHQQQQQQRHQQTSPSVGDAVDHLRSLHALGAKYTQPGAEPIDLGDQGDSRAMPLPMLASGCGVPPTSLGSLLSGEMKSDAFQQFRSNSFKDRSPQSRGGNMEPSDNHGSNDSPMFPTPLTHRQVSYGGESDGGLFGARGGPMASAYSSNGGGDYYHQQIQAHTANSRQRILSDNSVAAAYSQQSGGSNLPSYGGGQLDLSVSTGNRPFQQQAATNPPYGAESGQSRFTYEEQPEQPVYYNANPRSSGGNSLSAAGLPPPLGMYEQNYRNCYQNNPASMTAAAVAAAYNYHYQQQQQNQIHQQQEVESPYDHHHHRTAQQHPSYDYVHNRYTF